MGWRAEGTMILEPVNEKGTQPDRQTDRETDRHAAKFKHLNNPFRVLWQILEFFGNIYYGQYA